MSDFREVPRRTQRSRAKRKPRLTPEECRYFDEVNRHVVQTRHWSLIEQAFSDTHDGGLYECEVTPLVRKKLLIRVPCEKEDWGLHGNLLGSHWHVMLSPLALRTFWPDRADAIAAASRLESAAIWPEVANTPAIGGAADA